MTVGRVRNHDGPPSGESGRRPGQPTRLNPVPAPEGIELVRRAICAEALEAAAASFVALLEPVGDSLWTTGAQPSGLEGIRVACWSARFAPARAFERGRPYRLDDVASASTPSCPLAQRSGAACALYLPVQAGAATIAVLAAGWTTPPHAPDAIRYESAMAQIAERTAASL